MALLAGAYLENRDSDYGVNAPNVAELTATAAGCKTLRWQPKWGDELTAGKDAAGRRVGGRGRPHRSTSA